MTEETHSIPKSTIDDIHIALSDAFERLDSGTMLIKRCINYLEENHECKRPAGYIKDVAINNASALLKELQINSDKSQETLVVWALNERDIINQTIEDLEGM
jgi:hypothetical protein